MNCEYCGAKQKDGLSCTNVKEVIFLQQANSDETFYDTMKLHSVARGRILAVFILNWGYTSITVLS